MCVCVCVCYKTRNIFHLVSRTLGETVECAITAHNAVKKMSQEWKVEDELLKEMGEALRVAMGTVRVASLPVDAVECAAKAVCALPGIDCVCAKAAAVLASVVPDGARQLVHYVTAEALQLPPLVERIFAIPQRETARAMGDAVGLVVATLVSGAIHGVRAARKASTTALTPVPPGQHTVHVTSGTSEGVATYVVSDPLGTKVAPIYLAEIKAWPNHAASLDARPKYGARTQTSGVFVQSLRHLKEVARSNGCVELHLSLDPANPRFFAMLQRRLDYVGERLVTTNIIPSFSAPTFRIPVTLPAVPFAGSAACGLIGGGAAASHSTLLPRPTPAAIFVSPVSLPDRSSPHAPGRASAEHHTSLPGASTSLGLAAASVPASGATLPSPRLSAVSPSPRETAFLRFLAAAAAAARTTSTATLPFATQIADRHSANNALASKVGATPSYQGVYQYLESYAPFRAARLRNDDAKGDGASRFVAEVQSGRRRDAQDARLKEVASANARSTARILTSASSASRAPSSPPPPQPDRASTLGDRMSDRPTRGFPVPMTAVVSEQTGSWNTGDAGIRSRFVLESDGALFFTAPDTGEVSRVYGVPPPAVATAIRQSPPPPSVGDRSTSNGRVHEVTHVCRGPAGNFMGAIVKDVTPQNRYPFLPNYQPLPQHCIAAQPDKSGLAQYSHITKADRWYLNTNGQVTQYENVPGGGRHFHYGPFSAFPPEVIARFR